MRKKGVDSTFNDLYHAKRRIYDIINEFWWNEVIYDASLNSSYVITGYGEG
jgi:hypothetical protein